MRAEGTACAVDPLIASLPRCPSGSAVPAVATAARLSPGQDLKPQELVDGIAAQFQGLWEKLS
eukprot:13054192-Alexandrium_andersonii.AAC.1